ncbi:T9SS C-terminal target domain-containing protein [Fibrisoma montanum]|uniref:T9SS C-terminal target domain-containing protein n=1 Tax=Fibrisoma montanum TaxID=2305895 RepID=A0A418M8G5_9BACT|nr:T9SS type A sorting domain-containing protein [Fibrisoma montanum]RIV22380.1 T9SS C-terminal target domain-containing protein [Fibrisoma montanum]
MKHILLPSVLILAAASVAVGQEYPVQQEISRAVTAGSLNEAKAVDHLAAHNVVQSGAAAFYAAGKSVTLRPGFTAQAGAVFQATVENVVSRPAENEVVLTVSAYPNPFEDVADVQYVLPSASKVSQTLTDGQGRVVRSVATGEIQAAGKHQTKIEGRDLPTGVYLYQIQTDRERKLIRLLKK